MPRLGYLAHRANESYKLSQKWQENPLRGELEAIRDEVFNQSLANLFAQTVRNLVEESGKWWSLGRSSNLDRIETIVFRVKEQVFKVNEDNESHLKHGQILQEGMKDLKTFVNSRRLAKIEKAEAEAVQQDQQRHESIQHQLRSLTPSDPDTKIQAYFMGDPDKEAYLLPQDHLITTYNDIMWHLCFRELVQAPELWARREDPNVQPWTTSGRHWIYVSGDEPISETVFDIVEMATVSNCYIVALVDNGERERPVPVGIPIYGKETCCDLRCGSLRVHLESVWTGVRVEHARLFRSKKCVLETPLDSKNFGVRKNELYVKVMTRMEEDLRSATIETSP
ncbi:hypothetical protein FRC14_001004 [Serendipita sp. 396]|nr:hypothetical protein FRC14_001004 [Serendipita sp. 396]